jgi:hypothetical protein
MLNTTPPNQLSPYRMFFLNPWGFWGLLLSTSKVGSLVGTIIFFIILTTLYIFLPKQYTWWGIGLFLVWVGPVLFFLPFIFIFFVLPSIFYGEWTVPIGCGRDKETGQLICM